jgi:glutamate racemase
VLGCTHYPFVAPLFQEALGPQVRIIDTADAVARQTARVCQEWNAPNPGSMPVEQDLTQFWTSGDPAHLSTVARNWLSLQAHVHALP